MATSEKDRIQSTWVRKMCASITRRGPDDEGYYFSPHVGLGMRRLAIIDVRSGQQPVHNEDESIWVVFNGEIYNYRDLQTQLESRGHVLRTSSDTECLVHLYEDFGDDFVSHLRGMFAFAIWDSRQEKLLLGRDRLGIKPLYYSEQGNDIVFGSELKCLLSVPEFPRRINQRAVSEYFSYKYVPGPMTIYEQVVELPPAHLCVWRSGKLELKRYWNLSPSPDYQKPLDYFREGLLYHLKEAVNLHLVSEVPLGAFLSGGIDSSAIVALMSQAMGSRPKTFTVGFQEGQLGVDERPFARTIAQAFETDHSEYLYENPQSQIEQILPNIIRSFDEPFADSSVVPNYLVCEAARKLVTVALSGTGGDELFAGYERYRGALFAGYYRRLPRWFTQTILKHLVNSLPESRSGGLWVDRLKRFIDGADLPLPMRYQRYLSAFDETEKEQLFSGEFLAGLERDASSLSIPAMERIKPCDDALDWILNADMHTYLPDDELRKTDRLSMWHSLEVRVPFLDHKLVEFVATIPSAYKLKGWEKKYILIEALKGIVPGQILHRRKQGFSIPLATWLREPLRELVHTFLSPSALKEVGLFNPKAVEKLLEEHDRLTRNHETRIWVLLTFMMWHRMYIRSESSGT
jgi:asparagine synthase (glutamine-hydrolysing)